MYHSIRQSGTERIAEGLSAGVEDTELQDKDCSSGRSGIRDRLSDVIRPNNLPSKTFNLVSALIKQVNYFVTALSVSIRLDVAPD